MTKTIIKRITKRVGKTDTKKYYTLYFDWFGDERFTYLNVRAIKYWKDKGLTNLKLGLEIDIILMPNGKHFKIIGFEVLQK